MNIQEYRLGTLKRCEVEITAIIDTEADMSLETIETLKHLLHQIKVALGEEPAVPRRM